MIEPCIQLTARPTLHPLPRFSDIPRPIGQNLSVQTASTHPKYLSKESGSTPECLGSVEEWNVA
jgi:hypothetical protein